MNSEDRKIRELLQKVDTMTCEHENKLHGRIMRQLPSRGLRRIYLVLVFAVLWGGGLAMLVRHWRSIVEALLSMTSALLNHQLPSMEVFVVFALCIGGIVLVVVQGRDVMDEYYEHETRQLLQGRT